MKKLRIDAHHVISALDGYLHMMSMIEDDEIVSEVKRTRDNDYEITVEDE